jgi:tetratricopeptide (TPR) repeat protein
MICMPVLLLAAVAIAPPGHFQARRQSMTAQARTQARPVAPNAAARTTGQAPVKVESLAEAYALFLRAREAETAGDTDEALKLYQQAARLDPSSGDIPAAMAALFARESRLREALAAAESALRIDPNTVEAHWVLGTIYSAYSQGEEAGGTDADRQAERDFASRAVTHLEAVLNARGNTAEPDLLLTLGRLYIKTSDFDKAIALLARFNEIEPDSLDGVALLSDAYSRAGRGDDAIALLRRGAEHEPVLYPALATALERAGRWKDAVDAYASASGAGVNSADMRRRWAVALMTCCSSWSRRTRRTPARCTFSCRRSGN